MQESVKSAALPLDDLVSLEYKPCMISPDPSLKEEKITLGSLNPLSGLQENISSCENHNQACTSERSSHCSTDSTLKMCNDSKIISNFTERGYPIIYLDQEKVQLKLSSGIVQREKELGSHISNKWNYLRQKKVKLSCNPDNKSTQGLSL